MTLPVLAPVRPARPPSVTVAFWLQLAAVAVLLAMVGLVVAGTVRFDAAIDRAVRLVPEADPGEVTAERTSNIVGAMVLGVPALALAAWLAATALPVRRGGHTARIMVFVAGGGQLLLCLLQVCGTVALVPFVLMFAAEDPGAFGEPPTDMEDVPWEESRFLDTLYAQPDPFADVSFAVGGVGMLLVLALTGTVVLLLAIPPGSRYFAREGRTHRVPMLPPGYAMVPVGYPAGYPICPDPSAHHGAPGQPGPSKTGDHS